MNLSEQRARTVTKELLFSRGWDLRPVSSGGQLLEEGEYKNYRALADYFPSKTGRGHGRPDFLLVDSATNLRPLVVIDTKASAADIQSSINDTQHYADAIQRKGQSALAVAVAGAEKESYEVRVQRYSGATWRDLTLHNRRIDWIPGPSQTRHLLSTEQVEVAPEPPQDSVLAEQASRLNEILRDCNIKDEFRPVHAAAFLLGTWFEKVSVNPEVVLEQININVSRALKNAGKPDLNTSLRVDVSNTELADRAWEIVGILQTLGVRSLMHEHDYLGQLYETFFRYTGGNTIGQYFTPRHMVRFICDLVGIRPSDTVFDPACGTGGFLIGALNRMIHEQGLTYEEAIDRARHNVFGIEVEPTTAALCVTNMILRGDGKSGILRANCFTELNYPPQKVSVALLNPPFPHKQNRAQKPASAFIDRAIVSVQDRGLIAAVVPYSLLSKADSWHQNILKNHTVKFIATLPADLFNPYSNYDTALIVIQKGVPHRDGKTFFARVNNDGYKIKKTNRVLKPGGGSQLPQLLDAYNDKTEIPEFTAFRVLATTSEEWAPETFIESAAHNDDEFVLGLEDFLRSQASFYVRYGHRLLGEEVAHDTATSRLFSARGINLRGVPMGRFNLSDYFSVGMGGKDEIEDLEEGDDPFVSTSERDNGVSNWKKANEMFPAGSITVATDGSAYKSFVQEFPFYAFYKVAVLTPKSKISRDALYYVSYLINREVWRFVRARKFGKGRITATVLYGPVDASGKPDFAKMASLIQEGAAYPILKDFRETRQKAIELKLRRLISEWKTENQYVSSVGKISTSRANEQIVRIGSEAVPYILGELEREPDHWFSALHSITGHNPVGDKARGDLNLMAKAWLAWGKREGIKWQN